MKTLALFLVLLVPLAAQDKSAAAFDAWWKQFQAAVTKRDAGTVTKGAKFPMQWENGPTREIRSPTAVAARFDFYFTADIKGIVASRTPESGGRDGYSITWKARGNEYSLYFKDRGTGWALDGLSEGPP